jgi:hypothetical protein
VVVGLVVGAVFLVGAAVHGWLVARLWRDPVRAADLVDSFAALPYSKEFRRGMVRASAATTAVIASGGLFIGLGTAWADDENSGLGHALLPTLPVLVILLMVSFALNLTITLLNTPKFLVPPHMRDDPSYFAARRGASRA